MVNFTVHRPLHRYRTAKILSYIYEFSLVDTFPIMFLLLTSLQAELESAIMFRTMPAVISLTTSSRTASGNMISWDHLNAHGLHRYEAKAEKP